MITYFSVFKKSWSNLFKSRKKYKDTKPYSGGSLTEFAENNNISLKDLVKFNRKNLKKYMKLTDQAKKEFQEKLKGEYLIVGYKYNKVEAPSDSGAFTDLKDKTATNEETFSLTKDSGYQKEDELNLGHQNRMLAKKITELEDTVNIIQAKSQSVEEIVNSFIEKESLIKELNDTKIKLNNEVSEKKILEGKIHLYSEKLIWTDYLKQYAELVEEYFQLAKSGYQKAAELYRKLQNADESGSLILGQLLMKYNLNLSANTGVWEEIINGITQNQVTSNTNLIKSFIQYPTNEEKLREFKRILFKDIVKNLASCMLILTEEMCNLSRFINNNESRIHEFEQYFSDFAKQLHSKTINLGLDFKHVPLFKDSQGYKGFTQRANLTFSPPYKHVLRGLEENTILEVVSYGFDRDDKTKVVLV